VTGLTALLDANILYPAPVRDIFLELAAGDLFRAKWSADIHREWVDALLRNEPHRDRAALDRTRDLMDRATRDCLVAGYETLIPTLQLRDPDDRHVLAAAIVGRSMGIARGECSFRTVRDSAPWRWRSASWTASPGRCAPAAFDRRNRGRRVVNVTQRKPNGGKE